MQSAQNEMTIIYIMTKFLLYPVFRFRTPKNCTCPLQKFF